MLKNFRIIWISLLFFSACKEEETITPRDYPFVNSLEVHSIDETGVSIDFEVLQKGRAAINSYGVEYIESSRYADDHNTLEPIKVEVKSAPSNDEQAIRISYDLVAGREYAARPYVIAGSQTIFGEPLFFVSKGVKGPEIKSVSETVLAFSKNIIITGDFFNSRLEDNFIEIPGLEDYFRTEVQTATRTEIKFRLSRTYVPFPNNNQKYSLRLTSGGKTVVLEDYFSMGYPSIASITPLVAYVGDEITVKFNPNSYLINSELYFNYNIYPSSSYPIERITEDEFVFKIDNLPPGKYPISLRSYDFSYEYPEQIEILSSWEVYRNNSKLPSNLLDYRNFIVGDKMLFWKEGYGDFQETYLYDLKNDIVKEISPKQNNPSGRGGVVMAAGQGKYLYYGLGAEGNYSTPTYFNDFSRLDLTTGEWESLPSFPVESTLVNRSFEYQEKIYLELRGNKNYYVFDPAGMTWSESVFEIPEQLQSSNYQLVVKDEFIYYLAGFYNFEIYRFKPGQQPTLFGSTVGGFTPKLSIQGNSLYLNYRTFRIEEIDLETGEMNPVQSLLEMPDSDGIPWGSSEGFLFVFLYDGNSVQIDKKIYKLR